MKREELYRKLKKIIETSLRNKVSLEGVKEDINLIDAYSIDSIVGIEILVRIENEFGITVDDEDLSLELMQTLAVLADYVDSKIEK